MEFVAKQRQAKIACEVVSRLRLPVDVPDVYGRVVGNVVITVGGARVDLNKWLLREGWARPGLYNSTTRDEMRLALTDHATAVEEGRGVWPGKFVQAALARSWRHAVPQGPRLLQGVQRQGSRELPEGLPPPG